MRGEVIHKTQHNTKPGSHSKGFRGKLQSLYVCTSLCNSCRTPVHRNALPACKPCPQSEGTNAIPQGKNSVTMLSV